MDDLSGSKILLVDDYPLNNSLLARALPEYKIGIAANGEDALAMAAMEPPDLILLDITMPGMDGFEVCRRLKQQPATRDIPVIFLTGLDDSATVTKGFHLGGVDYITKPFDIAAVQARVKNHLTLKNSLETLKHQKALLENTVTQQRLEINLARSILRIINSDPPRLIDLNRDTLLFVEAINKPCNQEGGDHLLVKHHLPTGKTFLSLKDQSGHSVNCVLRSIITDLLFNDLIFERTQRGLDEIVTRLNQTLCNSGLFQADEFCTGMMAELDNESLTLRYVAAGHPPLLVIRDNTVISLPAPGQDTRNLPLGFMAETAFTAGTFSLRSGDQLLIYSDGLHQVGATAGRPTLSPNELIDEVQSLVAASSPMPVSLLVPALLTRLCGSAEAMAALCEHNITNDDLSLIALELEPKTYCQTAQVAPRQFADIDALIAHLTEMIAGDLSASAFAAIMPRVAMVLPEAVLNAWKHGNQRNPDLVVTIKWRFGNDFSIEVIDNGKGFDFHKLPNPTTGPNRTAAHGRGIYIIRKFTDALTWLEGGRRLVMNWRHPGSIKPVQFDFEVSLGRDLWTDA